MDAASLLREARRRHGLDQRSLARLARTSQGQISRIERGAVSPSVATLSRLLAAMGERLELVALPASRPNQSRSELRADRRLTRRERVLQAAELSYALTAIAASKRSS